jgi:hypothetical protein
LESEIIVCGELSIFTDWLTDWLVDLFI